jgi:hypothetical protein
VHTQWACFPPHSLRTVWSMTLCRSFALSNVTSWTLFRLATRRYAYRRHSRTLQPWLQQYTRELSPAMKTSSSLVHFKLGTKLSEELFIVLTLRRLRGCEHERHNTLITLLCFSCDHLLFFVLLLVSYWFARWSCENPAVSFYSTIGQFYMRSTLPFPPSFQHNPEFPASRLLGFPPAITLVFCFPYSTLMMEAICSPRNVG